MNLSPHFTLDEFTLSQTAVRLGLENKPVGQDLANLHKTAAGLEEVRALLGVPILISSGYRSVMVNAAVGGARNSQHMTGQAADFTAPAFGSVAEVFSAIKGSAIDYDQCIIEYGRWIHISFTEAPRRQALVIDSSGTRSA